jgi:hypothetical protein
MLQDLLNVLHNQPELLALGAAVVIMWMIRDHYSRCKMMVLDMGMRIAERSNILSTEDLKDIGLMDIGQVDPLDWLQKVL